MTSGPDVHMRETDAFSWTMEKDPVLRMPVIAIALLDGTPDWDEVIRRMDRVSRAVPLFRQRVVTVPGDLAPPKWVVDERFDLSWHIRRIRLAEPGTLQTLLEFAATVAMEAFDPARPMWEVWLVEGLDGGGAAWLAKVHHTMTDGVGGMQLLSHVFDVDGEPLAALAPTPVPEHLDLTAAGLLRSALAHDAEQGIAAVRGAARAIAHTVAATRDDPRSAVAGAIGTWRTLLEAVAPSGGHLSPVMNGRSLRRRYGTVEVPLAALRAAARAAGGTVNDAFLTAVTGGLRRYHELHGATVDELRMTMPINVREPDDVEGGNRIALIRLLLPLMPVDPVERLAEISRRADRWKGATGLAYIEAAYALVNRLPASYLQGLAKHVDFVASNVPGFPMPVRLAGPRLVALYAFGPSGGTGVNVTMLTYADTAYVAVDADAAAVPDIDAFAACIREGFEEVLLLGHAASRTAS